MITTFINHTPQSLVVTIHSHVCQKDTFVNKVFTDPEVAEAWIARQYRDLYADVITRFLHQRRLAASHFKTINYQYESALAVLEVRFAGATQMKLPTLVQRIINSREYLREIYPPMGSIYHNWRSTIDSLVAQCQCFQLNELPYGK